MRLTHLSHTHFSPIIHTSIGGLITESLTSVTRSSRHQPLSYILLTTFEPSCQVQAYYGVLPSKWWFIVCKQRQISIVNLTSASNSEAKRLKGLGILTRARHKSNYLQHHEDMNIRQLINSKVPWVSLRRWRWAWLQKTPLLNWV